MLINTVHEKYYPKTFIAAVDDGMIFLKKISKVLTVKPFLLDYLI